MSVGEVACVIVAAMVVLRHVAITNEVWPRTWRWRPGIPPRSALNRRPIRFEKLGCVHHSAAPHAYGGGLALRPSLQNR